MEFKAVGDPPGSAYVAPSTLVFSWVGIAPAQMRRLGVVPTILPKRVWGLLADEGACETAVSI